MLLLLPEILIGALIIILIGVLCISPHHHSKKIVNLVSYILILSGLYIVIYGSCAINDKQVFLDNYLVDKLSFILKGVIIIFSGMIISYSKSYLLSHGLFKLEFFTLLLFSVLGQLICISSVHTLLTYLGIELMALAIYGLVAFNYKKEISIEAAIKYMVLGAIASGFLLYGISMIYGSTGGLSYREISSSIILDKYNHILMIFGIMFIIAALSFKLGLVPFHMWAPDVYQGGNTASTIIISTIPKIAVFALSYRILLDLFNSLSSQYIIILQIIAIASLFIANLTAIMQNNIKRMLAYSTISHMGFLLLSIISGYNNNLFNAAQTGFLYVLIYSFTSLGIFAVLLGLSHTNDDLTFDNLKGLAKKYPLLGFGLLIGVFSLAGIPPTIGFYAKLLVIESLMHVNMYTISILAIISSVIGAFYYLKIIKVIYFDDITDALPLFIQSKSAKILMVINLSTILILGIYPKILVDVFKTIL